MLMVVFLVIVALIGGAGMVIYGTSHWHAEESWPFYWVALVWVLACMMLATYYTPSCSAVAS